MLSVWKKVRSLRAHVNERGDLTSAMLGSALLMFVVPGLMMAFVLTSNTYARSIEDQKRVVLLTSVANEAAADGWVEDDIVPLDWSQMEAAEGSDYMVSGYRGNVKLWVTGEVKGSVTEITVRASRAAANADCVSFTDKCITYSITKHTAPDTETTPPAPASAWHESVMHALWSSDAVLLSTHGEAAKGRVATSDLTPLSVSEGKRLVDFTIRADSVIDSYMVFVEGDADTLPEDWKTSESVHRLALDAELATYSGSFPVPESVTTVTVFTVDDCVISNGFFYESGL